MTAAVQDLVVVHSSDESFVSNVRGGPPSELPFVQVWNSGTNEYEGTELAELVESLPFQKMLDQHVTAGNSEEALNSKRGNYQKSYGFCAQSFKKWSSEGILRHFGTAVPALLHGSLDPEVVETVSLLSQICAMLGVYWLDPSFLAENKEAAETDQFVQEELGLGCRIPLVTWHAVPINGKATILRHMDVQNGHDPMSQVVMFNKVMRDFNQK